MAFEAAHQLERRGVKVEMVMLLDSWLKLTASLSSPLEQIATRLERSVEQAGAKPRIDRLPKKVMPVRSNARTKGEDNGAIVAKNIFIIRGCSAGEANRA